MALNISSVHTRPAWPLFKDSLPDEKVENFDSEQLSSSSPIVWIACTDELPSPFPFAGLELMLFDTDRLQSLRTEAESVVLLLFDMEFT